MGADLPKLVAEPDEIREVADKIRAAGLFALDLEFASEGRYIPELCLVQVAWPGDDAGLALLDAQSAELEPIFELIAGPETEVVVHAGRQDVALLATRFSVTATNIRDTQIGAAFLGIGEQVGYGRLVGEMLGVRVDKGPQFTDWSKRPLSDRQLRYAAGDVSHLLSFWPIMRERLETRGRVGWVLEESAAMVSEVAERVPPEERYKTLGGWASLRGKSAGALVALASWRESEALRSNKPPSWILPDHAVVDLSRRLARNQAALKKARGVGAGTVRRYGDEILAVIEKGAKSDPPTPARRNSALATDKQPLSALLAVLVAAKCADETLPPKLVGSKTDCEELVLWHLSNKEAPDEPRMLRGWRREFIGDDALSLLRGEAVLTVEAGKVRTKK